MPIQRKHIITGFLAALTISGAYLYWQYTKLMDYCITFNRVKLNKASLDKVNFDVFLDFKNQSNLKIDIISQDYKVFLNGAQLTQLSNPVPQIINPESTSTIGVNIDFSLTKAGNILKGNAVSILTQSDKVNIRADINLRVALAIGGFKIIKINIPYVYETTLKEIMAGLTKPSQPQKSSGKCK